MACAEAVEPFMDPGRGAVLFETQLGLGKDLSGDLLELRCAGVDDLAYAVFERLLRLSVGGGHLVTLPGGTCESVEVLRRKPARMKSRPRSSPAKNSDVMPKRVRPLDRLGMKAPT